MASTWTLAPALSALLREVNARWPHRSKASDGTIGDTAHSTRKSEHNPDAKGVVRAVDITVAGIDKAALLKVVIGDSRVHYVISDRKIYSRTNSWAPRAYTGANPHDKHVHISLRNRTSESADWSTVDKAAADTSSWGIASSSSSSSSSTSKTLKKGSTGATVKKLQTGLNKIFPAYRQTVSPKGKLLTVDGIYGDHTERWVREFQRRAGIAVDGIVGPTTRAALKKCGVKL